MKKINSLLFVFITLVVFVFNSCSSDNEEDPEIDEITIVHNGIKGKFFKTGIGTEAYQFVNGTEVNVWTDIVGEYQYYKYQKGTLQVYPEKQYIIIKTESKSIQLWYEIIGSAICIYTDAERKNNITPTNEKPKELETETKEPNKEDGTVVLSPKTHYTYFFNRQPNPKDGYRPMYIFEKGTDKHVLTFHWYSYQRMSKIRNIDPNENKSLFRTDMAVWIKNITDAENNVYAFNTTTNCEVKIVSTGQIISTGMYQTIFSIHLEDEPNHIKYMGTVDMEYEPYE